MRTRPVTGAEVRAYAGKAEEYVAAAASEIEAGRYIAATSLAIHAAINAADAVCGARLGQRAAGEDHDHALALLKQAGTDGATVEKELRRLLPLKTRTEYPTRSGRALPPKQSNVLNAASMSHGAPPRLRGDLDSPVATLRWEIPTGRIGADQTLARLLFGGHVWRTDGTTRAADANGDQMPRSVSRPNVRPGRSAIALTARMTPGMNEDRS